MSTIAIILIVIGAVLLLFFIGGIAYTTRRYSRLGRDFYRHLASADQALEQARAEDRGWDRDALEAAARGALEAERSDFALEELHLVLVDDRPGVTEDRAHIVAVGQGGEVTVVLARRDGEWAVERLD